jgi:hypothetical protein
MRLREWLANRLRSRFTSLPGDFRWPVSDTAIKVLKALLSVSKDHGELDEALKGDCKEEPPCPFHVNVGLRAFFKTRSHLVEEKHASSHAIIAWIIRDWGGIKSGKVLTCGRGTFSRIASWSKILAFCKPEDYAIYDARVI